MCWCDICRSDGEKSDGPFWRIEINKYYSLESSTIPLWVLSVCRKWAQKLGLFFVATDFRCPAFYRDNASYYCSIIEDIAKKANNSVFFGPGFDGILEPAKPNCEACIRTRLLQYLGIDDRSWFDDWIKERCEMPIIKYARDIKLEEQKELLPA